MRALPVLLSLALLLPGSALAGRFAVGVDGEASLEEVAAQVEAWTGARATVDEGLRAVFVSAPSAAGLEDLVGVEYVESLTGQTRRLAFTPNDPLYSRQWHLPAVRAFDSWLQLPTLVSTRVAVIDSGIDGKHPEFRGRVAAAQSFVGGSPWEDTQGHGTFVAGEIAAATGNAQGIAGLAFPAQLVIAKVTRGGSNIPVEAEAKAIRWAVDRGARVINLSLAGVRDPDDRRRDSYSKLEAAAVAYAHRNGALVVAAVGNGDQMPQMPWSFAGWPAALPHVVGVSALARDGDVPNFSNRDPFYNDIAAPGGDIFSTLPRNVTETRPGCVNQGYSDCGPLEYRRAEGTSFAAPLVSAAAALILSTKPGLKPDQVSALLTRTAFDVTPATGCSRCRQERDQFTGWGRLNVAESLSYAPFGAPPADRYETNDDAGANAPRLYGNRKQITATIDFWDDQIDVYSVRLEKGEKISATLRGPGGHDSNLLLWKPGTTEVEDPAMQKRRAAQSLKPGSLESIRSYRAPVAGWYFLEVKISSPGSGTYVLGFTKRKSAKR